MTVHRQHVGKMRRKLVIDNYFTSTRLVQDGDLHAVAERRAAVDEDKVDAVDQSAFSDNVIGDIAPYGTDAAVVPDGNIVERRIGNSGMELQPSGKGEILIERPQTDISAETDPLQANRIEPFGNLHAAPVFSAAATAHEDGFFFTGQRSVCLHDRIILRLHFLPGSWAGRHPDPWKRRYDMPATAAELPTGAEQGNSG